MKACIVDDDYTSRVLLGEFLKDQGWEVILFVHPDKPSENNNTLLHNELKDKNTKLLIMDVRFGRDTDELRLGLTSVKRLVELKIIQSNCLVIFVSQFGRDHIEFTSVENILKKNNIEFYWFDKPVDFVLLDEKIHQFH